MKASNFLLALLGIMLFFSCENSKSNKKIKDKEVQSLHEAKFPFYDTSLSMEERIQDLISRLNQKRTKKLRIMPS